MTNQLFPRMNALQQRLQPKSLEFATTPVATVKNQPNPSKYKWSTSLDGMPTLLQMLASAVPMKRHLMLDTCWWQNATVKSVHRSASGSLGVYFVDTTNGVTVLKPPAHSLLSEMLASVLSQSVGVYCPVFRLIRSATEEGAELLNTLHPLDPNWLVMTRLHNQIWILSKEFMPGRTIADLDADTRAWMESADGRVVWMFQVGQMLALDVLLNNGDRIPLIWDNQGNGGNVYIVRLSGGKYQVINLDAGVRSIDPNEHNEQFQEYKELVLGFLARLNIAVQEQLPMPEFLHAIRHLSKWSRMEITDKNATALALMQAFLTTAQELANPKHLQAVQELFTIVQSIEQADVGAINLNEVSMEFITTMFGVFENTTK